MSPRTVDLDLRREQILEAAASLFARSGFDQTSMDDIAAKANLSKGGLYWHFKSKDEIILAILGQHFDRDLVSVEALIASDLPASEALHALARHFVSDMEELGGLHTLTVAFFAAAIHHEDVRQKLQLFLERYCQVVEALIGRGLDTGEFRAHSAREVALTLIAQFEGSVLLWMLAPATIDFRRHCETAVALLLDGLRCRS